MKLSDRLLETKAERNPTTPRRRSGSDRRLGADHPSGDDLANGDPFKALRRQAEQAIYRKLAAQTGGREMSDDELEEVALHELEQVVSASGVPLNNTERDRLVAELMEVVLGFGALDGLLRDHSITEIMVNGTDAVFVERHGVIEESDVRFSCDADVRRLIDRIVAPLGRRIDEASPMVDARLPDGSRVNAVVPPLAVDGPMLTIRKFAHGRLLGDDLVANGSLSQPVLDFLAAAVKARLNILVSGGTGAGKTTLLNILSDYIPETERIVTIEDAAELRLHQRHVIRLEGRPPNIEGRGHVTIRDLLRNSLRMRPDRIIIGEARSGEALDMLQAMNTGHDGSLSTVHANAPRDALARVETMVLMAGMDLPLRAIREQIASAIDLVVQIARLRDGSRRIVAVAEVVGLEGDVVTMNDLFSFRVDHEDERGRLHGALEPTGVRATCVDRIQAAGVPVPSNLFVEVPTPTSQDSLGDQIDSLQRTARRKRRR